MTVSVDRSGWVSGAAEVPAMSSAGAIRLAVGSWLSGAECLRPGGLSSGGDEFLLLVANQFGAALAGGCVEAVYEWLDGLMLFGRMGSTVMVSDPVVAVFSAEDVVCVGAEVLALEDLRLFVARGGWFGAA